MSDTEKKAIIISAVVSTDVKDVATTDVKIGGDEDKKLLVATMNEFNGLYNSAEHGIGVSYIPREAYWCVTLTTEGKVETATPAIQISEMYRNWLALGKGKPGIIGSAIRYAMRHLANPEREVIDAKLIQTSKSDATDIKDFKEQMDKFKHEAAIWAKQYPSILALNGASLVTIGHHWDSKNLKPWDAVVQSLGQQDKVDQSDYRPIFYLATHPVPLELVEAYRARASTGTDLSFLNAVSIRSRCIPATTGAFMVCAAAINDLLGEAWGNKIQKSLEKDLKEMSNQANLIRESPASFSPLAVSMGKTRRTFEAGPHKRAMIIITGYVMKIVKGTLSGSKALQKFYNTNKRSCDKWGNLFDAAEDKMMKDLDSALQELQVQD